MISPSKFRSSSEVNVQQQIEHLTSACMTIASGVTEISAALERNTKSIRALERVDRGYSWPQIALLLLILIVLVWIALHLPR